MIGIETITYFLLGAIAIAVSVVLALLGWRKRNKDQ